MLYAAHTVFKRVPEEITLIIYRISNFFFSFRIASMGSGETGYGLNYMGWIPDRGRDYLPRPCVQNNLGMNSVSCSTDTKGTISGGRAAAA
jgi:hypothetical protein